MPSESFPGDRKAFFRERKRDRDRERSSEFTGGGSDVSRWRENPRRGSPEFRSRQLGHGKQGGWHNYSEESGHGFTCNESYRPARADAKYGRNSSRENRGSFSRRDWRGRSWENGPTPKQLAVSDQRSVDDMLPCNSHPRSDFVNDAWDQPHLKDQHNNTGNINGFGTDQSFERGNLLGSTDWKPLKWARTGSLSSRGSGFSHSSGSKSMGVDSSEVKVELQLKNVIPVQSHDASAHVTSAAPSVETSATRKSRLGWGEGLAKYEKKVVEGPDDSAAKHGLTLCVKTEPLDSHVSNPSDKNPGFTGFSDCASPATPSSVACSSSPGVEDKPSVKAANIDSDTSKLSGSPSLLSRNHVEGIAFNLENLGLTPLANLSSSLGELLQPDDPGPVDSSYERSAAMKKLLVWKGEILKEVEFTESEIDLLENELKSLASKSRNSWPCRGGSSSLQGECQTGPCEELVVTSNVVLRPAPLQLVSSADMIAEEAVGVLEEEHGPLKYEDIDSPGTVTSKFVESLSTAKAAAPGSVRHRESSGDLDSMSGGQLIASRSYSTSHVGVVFHCDKEDILYDQILASNKESANRASEVFNKLWPSEQSGIDMLRTPRISCWQLDLLIKEKFLMRKRFLKFKERVNTLKFRAFQHLWKEDMRLLSIRKYRAKSQKRLELSSRTLHNGYQKHRSSIHSRLSSCAGNLSIVPTKEMINFTRKLLSDSQVKIYRNSLKMPALILGKKEKMASRFISSNGLVEDPCAVEKERVMINSWTPEEKEVFMDKLTSFGKEFNKIASFLDHKTTADCVEFYYKNHKSDCFLKIKKKPKFSSANNYMVTSGVRWNRETNAASLDLLGAAIAANADDGRENQHKYTRFLKGQTTVHGAPRGDDAIVERVGNRDIFSSERETVAVDVLAGICGSLSSEAMSSCTTNSFGPSTRRPLTPGVTQNVDNETSSDDSCGEMNPADWTDDEKSIFIQAVSSYGKDFAMISRCVRTRSGDECRVFFSKARKCLGLDMIRPRPNNEEMPVSDNANGGGGDNEDACVVETDSVICSEKSGSKIDEDMMVFDSYVKHCESGPEENNGTGGIDYKDPELQSENMVTENWWADGKSEQHFDGDMKLENGVDSMSMTVEVHDSAASSHDTENGVDDAAGEGTTSFEVSLLAKVTNDHDVSVTGVEREIIALGPELGTQQQTSENNLNDKQEENGDANTSGSSDLNSGKDLHTNRNASNLAGFKNAPVDFGVDTKQEQKIALKLNPPPEPHVASAEQQDVSLVNANSVTNVPPAGQYEKILNTDTSSTLDLEKISDKVCQKSANADDHNPHHSGQILRGYPLQVFMKKQMNRDVSSNKLASLQSLSKVDCNFSSSVYSSQECFLQKCNGSQTHSSVAKLPLLFQEPKSDQCRPPSRSLSDTEKLSRNGDVKLFGQILNTSVIHENDDMGIHQPKYSRKNFNLKFNGTHAADGNSVPPKLDRISYLCLENVPVMRSYGFWDGNRIRSGLSALPDSAILRAKYPAAFGNYSTSSDMVDQKPLHSLVRNTEHNLKGVPVFSPWGDGVSDYQFMKQGQDMLFSEMQRRNGFEQTKGVVGINVVGRGGILGVSDPVAAIKMHYAKTQKYGGGQTASAIGEEESWRGKGDLGR